MTATDIKTARKTLGLTQAGLAERTGLSVDSIRSYEQGQRSVSKIAGICIEMLLKEADRENNK